MKIRKMSGPLFPGGQLVYALGLIAIAALATILTYGQAVKAQLSKHSGPAKFQLPITPDMPPLEDRTWTVRVIATDTGFEPSEIVAEPNQRIIVRFDNQSSGP